MNQPKFQITNPAYMLIAVEPRENLVGHVIVKTELPNLPPIGLEIVFDRQRAQEFYTKFGEALDVAKGLKKAK